MYPNVHTRWFKKLAYKLGSRPKRSSIFYSPSLAMLTSVDQRKITQVIKDQLGIVSPRAEEAANARRIAGIRAEFQLGLVDEVWNHPQTGVKINAEDMPPELMP